MDYSKAKVYKICNCIDNELYVGSTCQSLSQRMGEHRRGARKARTQHFRLYQKMNELGVENFSIVLLEEMPECQNIEQLRKKERDYIEELNSRLNQIIPSRTKQEWTKSNPEKVKDSFQKHYEKNKEKIIEKAKCFATDNPDKVKAYQRRSYEKNKEKYHIRQAERIECEICKNLYRRDYIGRHIKKQHS